VQLWRVNGSEENSGASENIIILKSVVVDCCELKQWFMESVQNVSRLVYRHK
jgi:hypothetical protein